MKQFQEGKLYYLCSYAIGEHPIPSAEPYVLNKIDAEGFHFVSIEEFNLKGALEKLDEEDRLTILNATESNGGLFVPLDEDISEEMLTPQEALRFLENGFNDSQLLSLLDHDDS